MLDTHSFDPHTARVMALYPDGWHAFKIADGTTFGELALSLEDLECAHRGAAVDVEVRFGRWSTQSPRRMLRWSWFDRDAVHVSGAYPH
jgi:hypothetical protein